MINEHTHINPSERSPLENELAALESTRASLKQSIATLEARHDAAIRARTINDEKRAVAAIEARIAEIKTPAKKAEK